MATAKSNGASPPQGQGPQSKDVPASKPALAAPAAGAPAAMPAKPATPAASAPKPSEPTGNPAKDTAKAPAGQRPATGQAAAKAPAAVAQAPKPAAVKDAGSVAASRIEPAQKAVSTGAPKSAPASKLAKVSKLAKASKPAKATTPAKPARPAKPAATALRATPAKAATGAPKAVAASPKPVKEPSGVTAPAAKAVPEAPSTVVRTARAVAHTVAEALDRSAEAARRVEAAVGERQTGAGAETLARVGLAQARDGYAVGRQSLEQLQGGLAESAGIASKGALEINGKVLDLVRAQADAAFGLWRQLLGAGSLSEAVQLQTRGWRHGYEMTSSRLKDIAETTGRVAETSIGPVRRMVDTWSKETRVKRGG